MDKLSFLYCKKLKKIEISFPLTSPTGKVRVRKRNSKTDYGYQVPKDDIKDSSCYIDWQIEYDSEKRKVSNSKVGFTRRVNNKQKYLFSLSDFLYFFYKRKVVSKEQLEDIKKDLLSKTQADFILTNSNLVTKQFKGTLNCQPISISNFSISPFSTCFPTYLIPLSSHIDVEVGLFEGGVATSSLMPHLYVCIPFTSLKNFNSINGKASGTKAKGEFVIDASNINTFLEIFHILGLLSEKHCSDVIDIIDVIVNK